MGDKKEGCSVSYLQASFMGRPIYERMGYCFIEEYQEWKAGAQPSNGNSS